MSEPTVRSISGVVLVSEQMVADADAFNLAISAFAGATPAQRAQWAGEATARRAAKRAESPYVDLTLDSLLGQLGWSRQYAEHHVQPYCECGPDSDGGWWYCQYAEDEGVTR